MHPSTLLVILLLLGVQAIVEAASRKIFDHNVDLPSKAPLVVGHRGSSGVLPEHTVAAYERAITDGADVIECDIHLTRDLIPVCMHDVSLSSTTNVASVEDFAGRNNTYTLHGIATNDWYVIDFTLAELKTLRCVQSLNFRDQRFNFRYQVPTLQEFIDVAKSAARPVGIYPETKSPGWHNDVLTERAENTTMESIVVEVIKENGYSGPRDPCFLQSFEEASLMALKNLTDLPLVMLTEYGQPSDAELQRWTDNFYGLGAWKDQVAQHWDTINGYKNVIFNHSNLVMRTHQAGLKMHLYTLRNEDRYLPWDFNQDPYEELRYYVEQKVDGYFTDFPQTLRTFLNQHYSEEEEPCPGQSNLVAVSGTAMCLACIVHLVY